MTSGYAVCAAIVYFNIAMIIVASLARKTSFLVKYSTSLLMIFAVLGLLRMVLPLDPRSAYIIQSYKVYPAIRDATKKEVAVGSAQIKLGTLLLIIWFSGTLFVLIKKTWLVIQDRKRCRQYKAAENKSVNLAAEQLHLRNAEIIVSPDVGVPMSTGIFSAHIFLPDITLSEDEWKFVIAHEYQHIQSHDTLIRLFYLLLLALFWWNPVVYQFQKTLDQLLELRCDANVTKSLDKDEKALYLTAILDVMRKLRGNCIDQTPITALPLIKNKAPSCTAQRFEIVLNSRQKSNKVQTAIATLAVCMFLLSYFVILQPAGYPSSEELEGGVSVTPEDAYIFVKSDGTMQLYANGEVLFSDMDEKLVHRNFEDVPIIYEGENK